MGRAFDTIKVIGENACPAVFFLYNSCLSMYNSNYIIFLPNSSAFSNQDTNRIKNSVLHNLIWAFIKKGALWNTRNL